MTGNRLGSATHGWDPASFFEAGVSVHVITGTEIGMRELGTGFQFVQAIG
jgi:hypothetical protein